MWRSRGTTSSARRGSTSSAAIRRAPTGRWSPRSRGTDGGRVLVFVMGAFAEMSEDLRHICGIIAHELARTHVSCYNELELELILSQMAQKPMLRGEVGARDNNTTTTPQPLGVLFFVPTHLPLPPPRPPHGGARSRNSLSLLIPTRI